MNTNKRLTRSIAAGIIVLFFTIGIIPCMDAGNILNEKESNILNMEADPYVYISGTQGENGWYISCASVTFAYVPELVKEIWYKINQGNYQRYLDTPIEICNDGRNIFNWHWIDFNDYQHNASAIMIPVDKTAPTISLSKKASITGEVTFTATVKDEASGIVKVEFYLDEVLQETLTEEPYKWVWSGEGAHPVYAIAYNGAGFSEKSNTISTPRSLSYHPQFINMVFQKIIQIIFWIQASYLE